MAWRGVERRHRQHGRRDVDAWTRQEHYDYAERVDQRMGALERRLTGLLAALGVLVILGNVVVAALVARAI